jgi:stage III sporulation protein AB
MIGFSIAQNFIRRPIQLKVIQAALHMLETHIIYSAAPLPEALQNISQGCDPKIAPIFRRTGELLSRPEGYSAAEAWQMALEEFYPETSLNENDLQVLKNFGESLGISDREDQSKHLRLAAEQLKTSMAMAEDAAAKNVKMWNYMGLLGGLVLVLALY